MFEFRPPAVVQADAALTVALRAGDESAVRELFERYGGLVHAIALEAVDGGESERTAQITLHTFLQAWRNSEAFEPGRSFAPWLATLACSVAAAAGPRPQQTTVDALLADPAGWVEPPAGLADRVVAAVIAEAHVDPADIYTAADLAAVRAGSSSRSTTVRAAVIGLVGGLVLLLAGILVLSALGGSSTTESTTIELRPTGRVVDAAGSIEVVQRTSGLSITLATTPLPDLGAGGTYTAWVVLDDGTNVGAGSFVGGEGDVAVELSAAVPDGLGDQFVIVGVSADAAGAGDAFEDTDVIFRAPLP